jgi:hypothetical protein
MNIQKNMYKQKCEMCGRNKSPIDLTFIEPYGYYCKYPNNEFNTCEEKMQEWLKTKEAWNK